jgi:uncharacterized protein
MVIPLLEYFIKKMVDKPNVIVITEVEGVDKTIIEIRVAAQDIAKVVGREGRTFKALRSLVHSISLNSNKDIVVDVVT